MATRKGRKGYRKFKPRRTARRQSATGSILPPIDVRSKGAIGDVMKRISKGPLTIVLVYADWCGHCHHFMPHFDAAAKNSNRSIQAVKVNETMLPEVNAAIKRNNQGAKSINVEGYPSVLLVGQDGNEISQIEPVKDTAAMTKVMNQSAALANEAGLTPSSVEMKASIRPNNVRNTPPKVASLQASATPDFIVNEDMGEREGVSLALHKTAGKNHNNAVANNNEVASNNANVKSASMKVLENDATQQASLYSPPVNGPSLAMPPAMNADHDMENSNESMQKGGSLYAAMSQSAYTLAAPAALLATAALMMKRSSRHGKRSSRHGKRSSRHGKRSGSRRRV